ncbi:integrase domain-containing protein [Paraburkholderia sediminicola]|uniref:integrase domain-containing protein n=1 Tax=Paraburkholderia sediminicola TaxID=458836 RepID=UPI0038B96A6F
MRYAQAHRGPLWEATWGRASDWTVGVRMSQESLTADLCRAARRARGKQGNLTYEGREQALARFAGFLWNAGFQIHTTGQLKEKHIRAWSADMDARSRSKRTIANNLAHVRTALEGIKRRPFADKMSNAELGISGASRAGTKRPMNREEFEPYRAAVAAIDPGIAMVLELQLEFGLRAEEGVRCVKSLADWERTLFNAFGDGLVTIIHGTKGGKARRGPPLDRQRAAALVKRAIELSQRYGGKLVRKPDLKRAMDRYHYLVRKAGMTGESAPHSLRYAYTVEHLRRMREAGVSRREAAAGVSTWLGHGDGRGTWVEQVYGRAALAGGEA